MEPGTWNRSTHVPPHTRRYDDGVSAAPGLTADFRDRASLRKYAWLSIAAALATMGLKAAAYFVTGSVGLLSDAVESVVNLVGALMALWMLTVAAREPDEDHAYGHTKAEYFSSGVEGSLILVAALSIAVAAIGRLRAPQPLEQLGLGLAVSVTASLVNLVVARVLLRASRRSESVTLAANAHHLLTDVWTSAGVVVGVGAVALTGWQRLDPVVALLRRRQHRLDRRAHRACVGSRAAGYRAARDRARCRSWTPSNSTCRQACSITRSARGSPARDGSCRCTCWCPGRGPCSSGHELLERLEREIRRVVPNVTVFTHLESLEDPSSWDDQALDRRVTANEDR